MATVKEMRTRIGSVKSTQKITKALQMVAAAKLRRAQLAAEHARPYARSMANVIANLAGGMSGPSAPLLLVGSGSDKRHLVVVATSDRGLAGGFNSGIVRAARDKIAALLAEGKDVKIITIGRKARDQLRRDYSSLIVESYEGMMRRGVAFADADRVAGKITQLFEEGSYDVCTIIYNSFKSAMSQVITRRQLVPFPVPEADASADLKGAVYEFEPDEAEILAQLLPRNLSVQIFRALLESDASFQGAQMTAMDSATRNAGEMINRYTILINRTRQAQITKELIEIISGAEAV